MLRAKGLFPDRQCPLVKGLGFRVLALIGVEPPNVIEAGGHVGVLRPQRLFPNPQRPLVKGFGLGLLALIGADQRQIVEPDGDTRMLWGIDFLINL
jgi:hypothetical protein